MDQESRGNTMVEFRRSPPQFPMEIAKRVGGIPGGTQQENLYGEPNKKLVVGRDISLAGEITDCDTLVVEGKVKASLRESRRLEIGESGVFDGNVEIDSAEIKGRFEGEITVRGRLLIRRTGKVMGRIRYGELEIERGGQIGGDIEAIAEEAEEPAKAPLRLAETGRRNDGDRTDSREPHLRHEADATA